VATTRLIPLHLNKGKTIAQTLFDRVSYAENPDKTQGGELVAAYGCNPQIADAEFLLQKRRYEQASKRGEYKNNILAYHMRQSFKPGEISPQEALEAGCELAARFTKGNHAYIVTVHTDRKHIHCHIVFNSTTLDCTRKFNNFWRSAFAVRRLSDLICVERGLSVIENPKPSKGQDYGDWLGEDKPVPFRVQIQKKIDEVLPSCATFEELMAALKAAGYKVKDKRKDISLCMPGQGRAWRLKNLGANYTEAALRERIGRERIVASGGAGGAQARVGLLIDIQAKIQAGKGEGYAQWARIFNIKQAAKTLLFLKENGIDSYDDLVKKSAAASAAFDARLEQIKSVEKRLGDISELQKQIGTYGKTREVYRAYLSAKNKAAFFEEHRAEITLHLAAKKFFDGLGLKKMPAISALKQEYAVLAAEKRKLYAAHYAAKDAMRELLVARGNADVILGVDKNAVGRDVSHTAKREESLDL
jgi:hypothetical protein